MPAKHPYHRPLAALLCAVLLSLCLPALAEDAMPYKIDVDLVNQVVTVLRNDGTDAIALQCLCSSGGRDCTPTGTYVMPEKKRASEREEWYLFRMFGSYAQYASRIFGQFMFHSLPYTRLDANYPDQQALRDFGTPVSHGCIRLRPEDAKFIAEKCLPGTVVSIHKGTERNEGLRELLRQASYSEDSGQSYNEFFGISDDPSVLGNGAYGESVRSLQLRLRDLGIYGGAITSEYTLATVKAVREAQALLGAAQTGCADGDFLAAIARPDAPSAMNVPLSSGSSGPAVRALQGNLAALRLYDGDVDSVYDVDVAEAVRLFESVYGFAADGDASPTVQKAIYYEAGHLAGSFTGLGDYSATVAERKLTLGEVSCRVGIKLRAEPSDKAEALMSLRDGDAVIGLDYGDTWSRVRKGGVTGYVMNQFMRYAAVAVPVVTYADESGQVRYTLGVADGSENPARKFEAYLASGGDLNAYDDLALHATVATGEGRSLNLRATPSADGAILTAIPGGEAVRVLLKSAEWSLVQRGDDRGYALNEYLNYWYAPREDSDADTDEVPQPAVLGDEGMEAATVQPVGGGAATVYESADEGSAVLGHLPQDTPVDVLETADGWSLIQYKGHRGYVQEGDLRFILS